MENGWVSWARREVVVTVSEPCAWRWVGNTGLRRESLSPLNNMQIINTNAKYFSLNLHFLFLWKVINVLYGDMQKYCMSTLQAKYICHNPSHLSGCSSCVFLPVYLPGTGYK